VFIEYFAVITQQLWSKTNCFVLDSVESVVNRFELAVFVVGISY